ncbi:DNA cytosine methyltransferase [Bacillus cereus]
MSLTFIDLFAGIGGFRLGMEQAGHKCLGYVEWDKFARKSYEAIHNTKGEWTEHDINDVRPEEMPTADVWCFGFPCTDISVAGPQEGLDGARSGLFYKAIELIKSQKEENKPRYLFIENVKNLFSVKGGWDFARILISLDEAGYDAEWQLLNSTDFGVPQNRERVFIIGHLRGRSRREVFPVGRSYETVGVQQVGNVNPSGNGMNGNVYSFDGLSPTLTTNKGEGIKIIQPVLTPDRLKKRQNGRRMKEPGEPMFTLTTQDKHGIYDGYRIRRLTPKECWRLQGFPDLAFDKAREVNSDAQLYKQSGNSVTVPVIYEIAKRLV